MGTVLITGASRGIGSDAALRLARAGGDVHAGVRSRADGERLSAGAPSGRIMPVLLDVTDAGQIAALDGALPAQLDAVVNNAGIVVDGPIEALSTERRASSLRSTCSALSRSPRRCCRGSALPAAELCSSRRSADGSRRR